MIHDDTDLCIAFLTIVSHIFLVLFIWFLLIFLLFSVQSSYSFLLKKNLVNIIQNTQMKPFIKDQTNKVPVWQSWAATEEGDALGSSRPAARMLKRIFLKSPEVSS